MIQPITHTRWQEAQVAEAAVVNYDYHDSARAAQRVFDYLGIPVDQQWKQVVEIGGGAYPATSYCLNVHAVVVEPLWFASLEQMAIQRQVEWVSEPFENARIDPADEVWCYNALQHVRDPERVVTRAKEVAPVVRFFEPVDYPTCVYHPHTFTEADFRRWFGDVVRRYTDRLPGFFDADCCYGTWRRDA